MAFSLLRSDLADYADPTAPLLRPDVTRLVQQTTPMGASLRPVQPALTPDERDALEASGMTSLRRGYEAGRLGTDANAAFAREASLRADGRVAVAEAERLDALGAQRRAGIYSPAVTRVEDINGVGDAATWLAGQVGQGAASMQDPLAASAALTAVGTGLSFIPQTRLIGAGLRNLAAPGAAYAINAQQLKGEHYGNISEDPAVTARYTPQQLNEQANLYGLGAGALETVLPAMAGRALGGGALVRKAAALRVPGGLKFAGDLGLEGATELAQGEASRALHSELNPNRDASGDASNRLNEFLGGAAGAAGPGAIHAGADAAFSLPRRMGEVAREAVGTVTDLAKDATSKAKDKVSDLSDSLRAASAEKDDTRLADLSLLRGLPDDPAVAENPEAFRAWLKETTPKRTERVTQGLNELATAGDTRAAELLAGLSDPDPGTQVEALNAGSEHLIDAQGLRELAEEADATLDGQGEKPAASRLAARGGDFLGRVARRAGQTAAEGAKGLWDGLTRRQNRQWTGPEYEAARHRAMGAFDEAAGVAAAQRRSLARAELMGEILAERAKAQTPRYVAHRLDPERIKAHLGTVAQDLADLAESWGMTGQREVAADKRGQQFDNLKVELGSIAGTLRVGLKDDALPAVQAMRKVAEPGAAPLFDYLEQEIQAQQQPGGGQRAAAVQREAADHLVGMIPPETLLKLSKQGVDMTSAGAARTLMSTVRQAVRGSARATKQLDGLFGRETANRMLEAMSMTPDQQQLEAAYAEHQGKTGLIREGDNAFEDVEDTQDFEKRQAEKVYDKSSSSRVYGFFGLPRPRTDMGQRDPLVGEYDKERGKMRRPRLIPLSDEEAIANRAALLTKQLGDDKVWTLQPKSALEIMAEHEGISLQTALAGRAGRNAMPKGKVSDAASETLGVNPPFINKLLARYRDYMDQEAARADEKPDFQAAVRKRARLVEAVLLDRMDQAEGKSPSHTGAGQRAFVLDKAIAYLSSHGAVVAERGTNRDPQRIGPEEVLRMAERGKKLFKLQAEDAGSDKNNVLQFESKLADSKKPGEPGPLFLKASDIVAFARKARLSTAGGEDRTASVNVNEQYIRDLSDGIASLVSSGLVEGLPKEFSDGQMPDTLPLKTTTYGAYMWGKQQRVEARRKALASQKEEGGDAREVPGHQERVAADQDKDFFVAEENKPRNDGEPTFSSLTATREGGREIVRTSKYKANRASQDEALRSDEDEFAGQRVQSRSVGADATQLPDEVRQRLLTRMQMHGKQARMLGAQLQNLLDAAFNDGLALAKRYLRQGASQPQYLSPLLHALNGEHYDEFGTVAAEKAAVKALRGEAAKALLDAKLGNADRVALARLLAKEEGRAKITAANVKAFLSRAAETAGAPTPVVEVAPPATRRQKDAASDAVLDDMNSARARAPARAAEGNVQDRRPALTGPRDPLGAAMEQAFSAAAAKEDAAQLGKSSRPSGAGSADGFSPARKLNAQATQLHREIGRPGFAATHDSPIEHSGKFDWRAHLGKGEGNWVFGAGTYLSTSDTVHKFYKAAFTKATFVDETLRDALQTVRDEAPSASAADIRTGVRETLRDGLVGDDGYRDAEIRDALRQLDKLSDRQLLGLRSLTYQVSVDIPPERLLDWGKPLAEQPASIRLRALKAIKDLKIAPGERIVMGDDGFEAEPRTSLEMTGENLYREVADKLKPGVPFEESAPAASDYLQSLGILGLTYASEGGKNSEAPNYVIFDDSKIHTNFVAFNKQGPGNLGPMTDEQKTAVRVEIERLLGKQVAVDFRNIVGYSGEWIEARNVIEISTAAGPNAMSVGHHEALHAFFTKFVESNPRVKEAMVALADNQGVLKRLQALLADHPNALADLKYGEERLAYMYQFWAADMLDLPGKATTLFQKIHRFFRRVLGRITDEERAATIIEAFHRGEFNEPSAAGQVIAKAMSEGTTAIKLTRKADAALVRARGLIYAARGTLNASESPTARLIGQMFWTNPGEERDSDAGEGYINAKEAAAIKYKNLFAEAISDLSDRDLRDVAKILQGTNYDADIKDVLAKINYAPHRDAVEKIHKLLVRFHDYMTRERGMQIGKLNNYFPRVWNTGLLLEKQGDFVDMLLTKYDSVLADGAKSSGLSKEQVAQRIYQKLVNNGSAEHVLPSRDDGVLAPFFENSMTRELKWLQNADAEPFLSKDLIGTLTGYFHMGARAAEYTQRFGQGGEKLAAMLKTVDAELQAEGKKLVARGEMDNAAMKAWAARRMAQIEKSVGAMEGTLGSDIGSTWRNLNTWVTVYQNLRLLPLALFSSLVDPMGLVARGGTMRDAYDTFLRGMREVGRTWADMVAREPKQRQKDHWEKVAEYVGAVDAATFSHHVADEYSSLYMGKKAKRINDTFFRLNGMEAWNRGARVGATQAAVRFLEHHAKLPDTHSERWLKELGLKQSDLHFAADGSLITSKVDLRSKYLADGVKPAEADAKAEVEIEKTHYAIRRWVQGAVLTPNAAQRPAWSSDPHYSMFFHLKQFSYSFHQTLIRRAVNELDHGNLMPLSAFAWYIPVMVGSNIMRGMLQGGGELPAHMQGMSVADHINKAVWQTIGATGAIAVDASHDLASLAGPMVEQAVDALGQPIGRTITDALPAKPLYIEALR